MSERSKSAATTLPLWRRPEAQAKEFLSRFGQICPILKRYVLGPDPALWQWLDMSIDDPGLNWLKAKGDPKSGIVPVHFRSTGVLKLAESTAADALQELARSAGGNTAVAVRVGGIALATELPPEARGAILGIGRGPLEATLGVHLPGERSFISLPLEQQVLVDHRGTAPFDFHEKGFPRV